MHIRKPLRKWGNGYGIMISKSEAEALGAGIGALIDVELHPFHPTTVDDLPTMDAGDFHWRQTLDDALQERHDGSD